MYVQACNKRSILEKHEISANTIQRPLLKFLNELVDPLTPEICSFISNTIDYNLIEDLLYQRLKDFSDDKPSYNSLIKKYKQTVINNSYNEYLECAIECFIYIKLVTTNYIEKEIKNKNIFYCFMNDITYGLDYLKEGAGGGVCKLMIKNDLRDTYLTERTK